MRECVLNCGSGNGGLGRLAEERDVPGSGAIPDECTVSEAKSPGDHMQARALLKAPTRFKGGSEKRGGRPKGGGDGGGGVYVWM